MLCSYFFIVCILVPGFIQAEEELVYLVDVNNDIETRQLEAGLPENLQFDIKRSGGDSYRLTLSENKRLNANAPVLETVPDENGMLRVVEQPGVPLTSIKFYHDKRMGAAVKVRCDTQSQGPCQMSVDGSLNIGDDSYEIEPARYFSARSTSQPTHIPHYLRKVSAIPNPEGRAYSGSMHRFIDVTARYNDGKPRPPSSDEDRRTFDDGIVPNLEGMKFYNDGRPIPDSEETRTYDDRIESNETISSNERTVELLRTLLLLKELDSAEDVLAKTTRQKRANKVFAVEIVAVVDPELWWKYYKITFAKNGMNRDQATQLVIREKLAHVVNGMSLRYEAIEDPALDMYVTLSKFMFFKKRNQNNPLSLRTKTPTVNGQKYVNDDKYLSDIYKWAKKLQGMKNADHIMVFTGYELYYDNDVENSDVLGVAYVAGACTEDRVSVQQDGGYFQLTTVATHELGHNLGSDHDGDGTSRDCKPGQRFIMAPTVAEFEEGEKYTANPWKFSPCSIKAFKKFIGKGRCLLDHGNYYNAKEWELHNSKLPGEIYDVNQQCKRLRGDNSRQCDGQSKNSEEVCRTLKCSDDDGDCYLYAAARGTSCGQPSLNKWCIDGKCVKKTESTPQKPQTNDVCVDKGYDGYTCSEISDYFWEEYEDYPEDWCADPEWGDVCCKFCKGYDEQKKNEPEGTECKDTGLEGFTCTEISDFFSSENLPASEWCQEPALNLVCCQYCQG